MFNLVKGGDPMSSENSGFERGFGKWVVLMEQPLF